MTEELWPGVRVAALTRAHTGQELFAVGTRGAQRLVLELPWHGEPRELQVSLPAGFSAASLRATRTALIGVVQEPSARPRVWVSTPGGTRVLDLPEAPGGAVPLRAWATAGDGDGRFVVAYESPDRPELHLVRHGVGWRESQLVDDEPLLVDTSAGALTVHGDLDDVRVASNASIEVVAGPVGDPADGRHQIWFRPWLSYDVQPSWTRVEADAGPASLHVVDLADFHELFILCTRREDLVVVGDGETTELGIALDADCPTGLVVFDDHGPAGYAVQRGEGSILALTDAEDLYDPYRPVSEVQLPEGRLEAAAVMRDASGDLGVYSVVDQRLWRTVARDSGTPG